MATGYSVRPLRLVALLGALLFACGVASVSTVIGVDAATGHRLVGLGLVIALTVLFAGLQLSAIGIVGEYVGRGHLQMLAKPTYLVRTEVRSWDDGPVDDRQ
jgi:undecaprenyl-phosphate 4-deoxy-4-formamido-L-arabinose transferase